MKKISTFAIAVLMMLPATSAITACSDDDPVEENIEKPEDGSDDDSKDDQDGGSDGKLPSIPQDVLVKINEIYSKATTGPQEVTTVNQLAILTSVCAAREVDGPITVTEASLNGEDITLVTLGGTEFKEGQATTLQESQLAAFGKPNDYLTAVTKLFENRTIPQEKPVIVTGISLGGMIAQQVLGQKNVLESHKIKAVITFGSPITLPLDRSNVKVVRFADVHDKVPQLGESMLRSGMVTGNAIPKEELTEILDNLDKVEKVSRTSKYTDMIETHALSYVEDQCWSDVDFLGDKERKNILVLKQDMKFYPAPQIKK